MNYFKQATSFFKKVWQKLRHVDEELVETIQGVIGGDNDSQEEERSAAPNYTITQEHNTTVIEFTLSNDHPFYPNGKRKIYIYKDVCYYHYLNNPSPIINTGVEKVDSGQRDWARRILILGTNMPFHQIVNITSSIKS